MNSVTPSAIKGVLPAPPSKSMTVRAMAAALLARGVSRIGSVSYCDDGLAAMGVVTDMGALVTREREGVTITSPGIRENAGHDRVINCGESGLSMRMFAPIAALLPWETTLEASGSLRVRPMGMVASLEQLGVSMRTDQGHAPIIVRGPMEGGLIEVDARVSSQFLTGLLMALPLCPKASTVLVSGLKSAPYVQMTIGLVRHFGINLEHDDELTRFVIEGDQSYNPSSYTIEGDWSGAAFILVAGAIAGESAVTGLDTHSLQADRAIHGALDLAGARLSVEKDRVTAARRDLKPFTFDATDCPDLFPPLVALAANCTGTSVIHGAERLTHKESDRAQALLQEFGKLGIIVRISGNRMEVRGGVARAATVDAHNDHRIAMACAVAALRGRGQVHIEGSECVAKSYPAFFSDLERLKSEHE
jgi:3-phosphoshikimate 1-carboxyvinyltransferase